MEANVLVDKNERIRKFIGHWTMPDYKPAEYHDNWGYLMDAVEKINSLLSYDDSFRFTFIMRPDYCTVYDNLNEEEIIKNEHGSCFIELVYNTVVMFVDWHNKNMKVQTIESDDKDVYVTCPKCGYCESHPVDEQRHHLQSFRIQQWLPHENDIEVSGMTCVSCKGDFKLYWDYDNEVEREEE